MQVADVRPFNIELSSYLRRQPDGFGCRTQIRMNFLKSDGFHVQSMYDSIIDRTYACAILGLHVPCPTPFSEFVPDHIKKRWETEWPMVGAERNQMRIHGWQQ